MPGYVSLPAYRAPTAFDFTGLNTGIDEYNKKLERNRLLEQSKEIGASLFPATTTPATTDPTTQNPLMAPQSVPASPAQASAAAAGRDFPTSGTDYSPPIKQIESGGNYKAVGPITASGDRAYGAHQVMGANIPVWTKEILGQSLTPQQYLDNPDAQDKVFRAKFGQYVAKTGNPQDAASMWFTGKPLAQGANRQDLYGTTGNEYVRRFDAASGGTPTALAQAVPASAAATQAPGLSQGIDYRAGAAKAAQQGNVALAVQLLEKQQEQAKSQREEQTFNDTHQKAVATHVGNMANTVALEPDKAKQTAMWRSMVATDPEIAQGLRQNGIDPNDVESGTRFMINRARGITEKLGKDRYLVAGKRVFDTSNQQFISSPDGTSDEDAKFGKQIVYGIDENGDQIPLQAGDNATLAASKLPPGVKIGGKTPIRLDAGDRWILLDPVTRATIGEVSKNVAAEAQQKEGGKLSADAQAALPAAKTSVDDAVLMVNRLRTHPGLDAATGLSSVADPRNYTPGTDAYNFNVLNKQVVAKTFMGAREGLKGAGQVTDFEGGKGQDAIGRLITAQSKEEYLQALDDVERMMKASYSDLEKKAGLSSSAVRTDQPATSAPTGRPRAVNKAGDAVEYNEQTGKWEAAH